MSPHHAEPGLKTQLNHRSPGSRANKRRGILSHRRFGLMVTMLEERVLLSTPTVTSLALSSSSLTYGQTEVLTVTVTTDPPSGTTPTGGVVTFNDGVAVLGTGNLSSGTATLSTTNLPAGTEVLTAVYGGTSSFAGSSSGTETSVINTVAGGGDAANRQALYTALTSPADVAVDSAGDLFIADTDNNVIEEVKASTGAVTVVAGNGTAGYIGDGGKAVDAELSGPGTVILNSSNDLFIADTANNLIREVNLGTGIINTVAGTFNDGNGGYGGDGGLATAAELNGPSGLALDSSGNLYIADTNNEVIREVSASNQKISTVAGTYSGTYEGGYGGDGGLATDAMLDNPEGIAVNSSGDLFIADTDNDVIREVNATTKDISTVAGTYDSGSGGYGGDGGLATDAELNGPQGIFVTGPGNLYIGDTGNNVIREVSASTGDISTVAGTYNSGTGGDTGDTGQATDAELNGPSGLTLDSAGDLFIADTNNNAIREVDGESGVINTVVGGDASGYTGDGGQATAAELAGPTSVVVDGSGNIYVADTSNNVVREIDAQTGLITTVAGGTQPVYHPVIDPADPVMDGSGDLFVADTNRNVVYEVNHVTGGITVVAGDGTAGYSGDGGQATNAELDGPSGLALDSSGNLFVADSQNNLIREVNLTSGVITTYAGSYNAGVGGYSGDNGQATSALLDDPTGIALDSAGDLFIADTGNNLIREVDASTQTISTVAGTYNSGVGGYSGNGGLATSAELDGPMGVTVDSSGDLFIADTQNNLIREVNATTEKISNVAGTYNSGTGGYGGDGGLATAALLDDPAGIALDSSGDLFIADEYNNIIREVNATTKKIGTVAGTDPGTSSNAPYNGGYSGDGGPATAAKLSQPQGIFVSSGGSLVIADSGNSVIREVNATTGVITTVVGGDGGLVYSNDDGPATDATLANPDGIVVDSQGDIFIADQDFNVIREVNAKTDDMTTIAGNGVDGYSGDGGPATDAELADPAGLALDGSGDLFIADAGNNVIRELNLTTGIITTVAGNGTNGSSGDGGLATDAKLSNPTGVAVDSSGNIYIADQGNNEIREVNATTRAITTIAGDGTSGFAGDGGQATAAELAGPSGVALDGSGNLFIADTDNEVIRALNLSTDVITTVAGTPGMNSYSGDGGPPTAALLDSPAAVAVDSTENLYIADTDNNVIREVTTKASSSQTVTVTPATLTITASNDSKTYGTLKSFSATAFTETGLVSANGDTITGVTETSTGAAVSATVGNDPIVPSGAAGNGLSNYTITYQSGTLTVNAATLTITANNDSKIYGTLKSFSATAFTETGLVTANGDTITGVDETSTGAAVSAPAGTDLIVPSAAAGIGLSNYTINYVNGTLTVNPASLTITANNVSKTYGTLESFPGTVFTQTGLVAANGDTITGVIESSPGAAVSAPVGTYPIVPSAAAGTGLSNYIISYVDGTLTVTAATLTITANNESKTYGTLESFSATAFTETGLVTVNGDTITGVNETSTGTAVSAPVDTDPIVPSAAAGNGLSNYTISYVNGTLTVNAAPLTITANNDSKTYGTLKSFSGTAFTETGLVTANGDTITGVNETSTGAAVSAPIGTDLIVASAATGNGLSNYTISYADGTLTVNPATLIITANNDVKTYGDPLTFAATAFTDSGLVAGNSITSVTLTSAGAAQSAAAGTSSIVPSAAVGSGLSNYTITYDDGTLTVTPAPLTITANSQSMTAGQAIPALTVTYSEFKNGDTPASLSTPPILSTPATSASPAGTYPINVSGASSPNYNITFVNGVLTVGPVSGGFTAGPALATVQNVTTTKIKTGKHKTSQVIVVQFSEAMNQSSVENKTNYSLATIPAKKKQKSKPVQIASAAYNSSLFTVTLITRKPLVLNPPLKLTILGAGVLDALGRPLAGNSGTSGTNAAATLTKGGATVDSAVPLARARGLSAYAVDVLLASGFRAGTRRVGA